MRTASPRPKTVVLLLIAVLAVPLASAAGPRHESSGPATVALSPLELVDHLWSFLRGAWSKTGCHLDPSGLCSAGTAQPPIQTKEGCNIDPSGHCVH